MKDMKISNDDEYLTLHLYVGHESGSSLQLQTVPAPNGARISAVTALNRKYDMIKYV